MTISQLITSNKNLYINDDVTELVLVGDFCLCASEKAKKKIEINFKNHTLKEDQIEKKSPLELIFFTPS